MPKLPMIIEFGVSLLAVTCKASLHDLVGSRANDLAGAAQELALLSDVLLACPGAIKAASAVLVASASEGHPLEALTASMQASRFAHLYVLM